MATQINVKKPFVLNSPAGHVVFLAGVCTVEDEVAEHWYVQAHSEPFDIKAIAEPVGEKKSGRPKKEK